MTQQNAYFQNQADRLDRKMTTEEFTEVIAAISEGKYSWACVLILRIAGYNPLHYIPYRTYNRLIKDNLRAQKQTRNQEIGRDRSQSLRVIEDLEHLEIANQTKVRGGSFQRILGTLRTLRL